MPNDLSELSIQHIRGIGPHRATLLKRLGITTVRDAMYYLPYRYEDRSTLKKISALTYGQTETVAGTIISAKVIKTPGKHFRIFVLVIDDGSALLRGKWFNQPFMTKTFRAGSRVVLCGTVRNNPSWGIGFEMDNPEYELLGEHEDTSIHTNRIVPVYRVTGGLSVRQMRSIMFQVVSSFQKENIDSIPAAILKRHLLTDLGSAITQVHFPDSGTDTTLLNQGMSAFHKRLSFDELFLLQLGLAVSKKGTDAEKGISFNPSGTILRDLIDSLPFHLTHAQDVTFNEILTDMRRECPMNRLLQGDVGCGKTIVALMAMVVAAESGYQSALMAPTEILAEQHFLNIYRQIQNLGLSICLLTGSSTEKPFEQIASGEIDIVVGTHSLIQKGVSFRKLGLAIIDEQHRFGVMQRSLLKKKALNPDVLVMTATPIPRTLALTLFGDLDFSVINELPPGRHPVKTILLQAAQKEQVYGYIRKEVKEGRQVYVVYPVIEESEKTDLRSAITGVIAFERIFPEVKIGLLHGRMKPQEREQIMASFKSGEIKILACTTVIEVGVDVPNASLMVIIHAERFGLSQLHQLRGRIGRGPYQSQCIMLAYAPYGEEARRRLEIMVNSSDGFRIAEEDLAIRGPGEFFGIRQSGMPDLKIANLVRDAELLSAARDEAFTLVGEDPDLTRHPLLKKTVETFWKGNIGLIKTA
jgi:ATP-dependent DNA helicase RecG